MQPETYLFPRWLALVWVLGLLCLSIVYRRIRNKPIFFFSVPGADSSKAWPPDIRTTVGGDVLAA